MKNTTISLLIGLLVSTCVFGQETWTNIASKNDKSIYIDLGRTKKINNNYRVWVLQNSKFPDNYGNPYFILKSFVEYQEINCEEEKTRLLKQTLFTDEMAKGESLDIPIRDERWNFNLPNTRFDVVVKYICSKKK
jgi:hypothetical protein